MPDEHTPVEPQVDREPGPVISGRPPRSDKPVRLKARSSRPRTMLAGELPTKGAYRPPLPTALANEIARLHQDACAAIEAQADTVPLLLTRLEQTCRCLCLGETFDRSDEYAIRVLRKCRDEHPIDDQRPLEPIIKALDYIIPYGGW